MFSSRSTWLLLTLILVHTTSGFQFYLQAGERRCFTENVAPGTKVLGEYTVSTGKGNMEVDITVKAPGEQRNLYFQKNIGHGKFAFVVPFDNSLLTGSWKILAAEFARRRLQKKVGDVPQNPPSKEKADSQQMNHQRKLLSSGYKAPGHERQFDEHGRAKPPADHESHEEHGVHIHEYHDDHHDSRGHAGRSSNSDEHHHHEDEFDDDFDDFDMDDYDGIHDEELDEELEHENAIHMQKHGSDDADPSKKADLYEDRKIEVCVSSHGSVDAQRRRVRLVVHKGETAHDYTRLAKREHMTQLEVSLRRVSEELLELNRELENARLREDGLRKVNESTNGRVVMLAVVSLLSLAGVGSYQAFYTKRFLKRKKIL